MLVHAALFGYVIRVKGATNVYFDRMTTANECDDSNEDCGAGGRGVELKMCLTVVTKLAKMGAFQYL